MYNRQLIKFEKKTKILTNVILCPKTYITFHVYCINIIINVNSLYN